MLISVVMYLVAEFYPDCSQIFQVGLESLFLFIKKGIKFQNKPQFETVFERLCFWRGFCNCQYAQTILRKEKKLHKTHTEQSK